MQQARALVYACSLGLICAFAASGCSDAAALQQTVGTKPTRADCSACHEREYQRAPQHVDVKSTRCAVCHGESGWQPVQLSHAWALTGAHAKADCAACHTGSSPEYEQTRSECVDCHRRDFQQAKAPGHDTPAAASCSGCHTSVAWLPSLPKKPLTPTEPAVSQVAPAGQLQPAAASPERSIAAAPVPRVGAAAAPKPEPAKRSRRTTASTKRRAARQPSANVARKQPVLPSQGTGAHSTQGAGGSKSSVPSSPSQVVPVAGARAKP